MALNPRSLWKTVFSSICCANDGALNIHHKNRTYGRAWMHNQHPLWSSPYAPECIDNVHPFVSKRIKSSTESCTQDESHNRQMTRICSRR